MLNIVEMITTENETTLKNFSSPMTNIKRADCSRIISGIIISLNFRIRKYSEPLKKAVRKVKGKSNIRIEKNLFRDISNSDLTLFIKVMYKTKEIDKKNIRWTTSIS